MPACLPLSTHAATRKRCRQDSNTESSTLQKGDLIIGLVIWIYLSGWSRQTKCVGSLREDKV